MNACLPFCFASAISFLPAVLASSLTSFTDPRDDQTQRLLFQVEEVKINAIVQCLTPFAKSLDHLINVIGLVTDLFRGGFPVLQNLGLIPKYHWLPFLV